MVAITVIAVGGTETDRFEKTCKKWKMTEHAGETDMVKGMSGK